MKRPVALLTGFLGSGKTTLLGRLLAHPGFADTAVIVNEFGEVGIDHLIVAQHGENIVELAGGCLCCTIRGDLALTLRELHRQRCLGDIPAFARVVVETSGLAEPVPLLHTLMADLPLQRVYELDAVLCVADAVHGQATLAAHPTACAQLAAADVVLVSKVDCVARDEIAHVIAALRAVNGGAEYHEIVHGEIDPALLLGRRLFHPPAGSADAAQWLAAAHDGHDHLHDEDGAAHDHLHHYGSHVIRHAGALSLAGTSVFLNRVVNEQRAQVLRIKGLAAFRERGGRPAVLHAVQNKFYPVTWLEAWPDGDESSRLVFIGRDLDTGRIDELFASLCL
jgi:G3E family GTPase